MTTDAVPHTANDCPLNKTILTTDTGMTKAEINRTFGWIKWALGLVVLIGLPIVGYTVNASMNASNGIQSHLMIEKESNKYLSDKITAMEQRQKEWRDEQRQDMKTLTAKIERMHAPE